MQGIVHLFSKGTHMPSIQLERLKKDLLELEEYASKLTKKGRVSEARNILKKKEFMVKTLITSGVQIQN